MGRFDEFKQKVEEAIRTFLSERIALGQVTNFQEHNYSPARKYFNIKFDDNEVFYVEIKQVA